MDAENQRTRMKALIIVDIVESDPYNPNYYIWDVNVKAAGTDMISLRPNYRLNDALEDFKQKHKDFEYQVIDFCAKEFWQELGERLDNHPHGCVKKDKWDRAEEAGDILQRFFQGYDHIFCTSKKTEEWLDIFTYKTDIRIYKLPNEYDTRRAFDFEEGVEEVLKLIYNGELQHEILSYR